MQSSAHTTTAPDAAIPARVDLQQVRWLLRDKFGWTEKEIVEALRVRAVPAAVAEDLERLSTGEPLAYIIGWVRFLDCVIDLSLRPLVPRPETEYWVGEVLRRWSRSATDPKVGQPIRVLDMCCGSGCIGLSVLRHLDGCVVDFADLDPRALEQSKRNLVKNEVALARARLILSDVWAGLDGTSGGYDAIFANPPYIDGTTSGRAATFAAAPELAFEPAHALFADAQGLAVIREILVGLSKWVKPGGALYLEFGLGQRPVIEQLLTRLSLHGEFAKDQFGVWRWVQVTKTSSDQVLRVLQAQ